MQMYVNYYDREIKQKNENQTIGILLSTDKNETVVKYTLPEDNKTIFSSEFRLTIPSEKEFIDVIENLAIERAKKLFGAEYVNVQPHSGSSANMAALNALINPGDTVLGMDLTHGGHLTHGSPVNFSGKTYHFISYGVDKETEELDYEVVQKLAKQHKPKLIIAGASAYSRKIDFARFRAIADEVGAYLMVDMAHIAGLIAGGLHQNPVPYADVVTTTTHKTLRGPRGGMILAKEKYGKAINSAIFPGIQGGPLEHVIAAKAVALKEASTPEFKEYAAQIIKNAKAMESVLNASIGHLISGGTDNHLLLFDVTNFGLNGKEAEVLLDKVGITVNKNTIPFETLSPFKTSGIRIGTPAITTRGFNEADSKKVAEFIIETLTSNGDVEKMAAIQTQVHQLTAKHPLYKSKVSFSN